MKEFLQDLKSSNQYPKMLLNGFVQGFSELSSNDFPRSVSWILSHAEVDALKGDPQRIRNLYTNGPLNVYEPKNPLDSYMKNALKTHQQAIAQTEQLLSACLSVGGKISISINPDDTIFLHVSPNCGGTYYAQSNDWLELMTMVASDGLERKNITKKIFNTLSPFNKDTLVSASVQEKSSLDTVLDVAMMEWHVGLSLKEKERSPKKKLL